MFSKSVARGQAFVFTGYFSIVAIPVNDRKVTTKSKNSILPKTSKFRIKYF